MQSSLYRVGLTGGIASGKSLVSQFFADHGIEVIDADRFSQEVTQRGELGYEAICQHYGPSIVLASGELDRQQLADIIFSQSEEKIWLEHTLHPLIRAKMQAALAQAQSTYVLVVIPLLGETVHPHQFDRVCVVDCSPSQQLERLIHYRGLSQAQATQVMAAQLPRERRRKLANDIIQNQGDIGEVAAQVDDLHLKYCQLSQKK